MAEEEKIEISRSTYEQFKAMGDTLIEQKKKIAEQEHIIRGFKAAFELMVWVTVRFTGIFGMNNAADTMIKDEILKGEQNPTRAIMTGVTTLMKDAALAEFNPALDKKLQDKFSFFKWLTDIFEFNKVQKQYKVPFDPSTINNLPPAVQKELLA